MEVTIKTTGGIYVLTSGLGSSSIGSKNNSQADPSLKGCRDSSKDVSHTFQISKLDWINNTNLFQRIKGLLTLPDNWDGYGAKVFSRQQVQKALDLYSEINQYYFEHKVDFFRQYPFVAPCSDGSILFEWSGNRFPHKQLEAFVPDSAEGKCLECLKSLDDVDQELKVPLEEFPLLLDWLFSE